MGGYTQGIISGMRNERKITAPSTEDAYEVRLVRKEVEGWSSRARTAVHREFFARSSVDLELRSQYCIDESVVPAEEYYT
jgi:hypothetical protein